MKKLFILLFFIFVYMKNGICVLVKDIRFNGLDRVSLDSILSILPLKIGNKVSDEDIAHTIKVLFFMGCFSDIKIFDDNQGIFIIHFTERSIINNVSFYGNKIIKNNQIQDKLNIKNVKLGEFFDNRIIFEVEKELESLYFNLGKYSASVKIMAIPLSRNRIDLKIVFSEGESIKIRSINILGNYIFSKKKLLSCFQSQEKKKWWYCLFDNRIYNKQRLSSDLETLRSFYFDQGYAQFNIDSVQMNLSKNKKNIDIDLYVTEGKKYIFSSFILSGNIIKNFPNIRKYVKINSGELFSNFKIKRIENDIREMLGKHGYIKPLIFIDTETDDLKRTIKLYVYVDVGIQFYIREIRFEGNYFTKDSVLRRELKQIEMSRFDRDQALIDQERLKRLGFFKSVDTRVVYIPTMSNQIDLIYKIEEQNTGSLNFSLGVGTESGLSFRLGLHQNNFFGTGNSISITGVKNDCQIYSEISIFKPYLMMKDVNLEGTISYNKYNANYARFSSYNLKNFDINLNLIFPFSEYQTMKLGLEYMSVYLDKIFPQVAIWRYLKSRNLDSLIIFDKCNNNYGLNLKINDLFLTSEWIVNKLDRIYFPNLGSRFNLSGKITFPGSNNQYYKIFSYSCCYTPLYNFSNWLLMNSFYIGYSGKIYGKESPFYDNFYAGGIGTLRGFKSNSIGPKAAYYRCNSCSKNYETCKIENSINPVGGNFTTIFTTEIILPNLQFSREFFDLFRTSIFVDMGTVWDTFWKDTEETCLAGIKNYNISNNIRISSGISLQWMSPIGPVIFSYAKLIRKYLEDQAEEYQFSIGKTW